MNTPAILPPIKDPIPNQDSTIMTTQQYSTLPLVWAKWPTGCKPFFDGKMFSNKIEDKHNDSINNSRTENEYYVNNLNVKRMNIRMMNTNKIIHNILKLIKV